MHDKPVFAQHQWIKTAPGQCQCFFPRNDIMMPHPAHTSSSIRTTNSYIWSTSDVLGQGATGFVFKGRNKKTGQEYAIKVFNSLNFVARPNDVRKREYEVLRKVDHENIVRLYDVEEEVSTKHDVIIMELCSAGSLYNMLDDPENLYGLPEDEFKRVLSHITAGMNHLHDKGIVHRDLKPGNIMRTIASDGKAIYKLTDFGAARELNDNEQFVSLYGTEEYLHPDIYERAVLRKPPSKKFSATVDLWSMGVTFYHIATGQLPFRPYGGARRNKEIMYKITTEKPSGVISGVQSTERGNIEWSQELPKTCRLSQGLKQLFTPVLSGILECDPHKIWTFERYFTEVENILTKTVIDVFSFPSAMSHKVYISPEKTLVSFQEHVAELTDIRSSRQLMLYEGGQLEIEAFIPVRDYPATGPENPIILFSTDVSDFQPIPIPHTCKPPKVKSSLSLENDSSLAKVCSSTLFDIRKSVKYLLLVQTLIRLGVKWFVSYLKSRVMKVQILRSELSTRVSSLKTTLEIFEEHYQRETSLLQVISLLLTTPPEVNELKLYFTQITEKVKCLRQVRTEFDQISEIIRKLERAVIQDKTPASVFVDEGSRSKDCLEEKMIQFSEQSREVYKLFKKHKHNKRLDYSNEQLHKYEKQQLSKICENSVLLFTEQSVPRCKRLHKESRTWFSNMNDYMKQIQQSEARMRSLERICCELEESVRSLQRIYRDKLSLAETLLKETASRTQNISLPLTTANTVDQTKPLLPVSWPPYTGQTKSKSQRHKDLRELRKGLAEAKSSLNEVKSEVENSSDLLKRLSMVASASQTNSTNSILNNARPIRTNEHT
ncbi:unnamed protein product [Clavelina lepadiformis]|uniref:Protein kinase domain-containing protein n=1 Tax=Clavelina lepadiformis TaxID=159417 RepID=A0ABP0FP35_CLALP